MMGQQVMGQGQQFMQPAMQGGQAMHPLHYQSMQPAALGYPDPQAMASQGVQYIMQPSMQGGQSMPLQYQSMQPAVSGYPDTSGYAGAASGFTTDAKSAEINRQLVMRENARKRKDYATADGIKAQLSAQGVEVYDKRGVWTSSDGLTGPNIGM